VGFLADWRRLNVMLTRARRGCIVIGSRSTLISDPLWQQWLNWAAARGAIIGENAKGTWVPKYLVDDRDGVWTVKASVIEEAKTGVPAKKDVVVPLPKEVAPPPEPEIADSWEDLGSPVVSPSGPSAQLEALLEEEDAEANPPELLLPTRARAPPTKEASDYEDDGPRRKPAVLTRAQELRDARLLLEEQEPPSSTAQTSSGEGAQARDAGAASIALPSDDAAENNLPDGEQNSVGTPKSCPTSPMRNQALAKLGLVDELDLE